MMAEGGELPELFPPSKRIKSAIWGYFGYRKKADGNGLEEEGYPSCKTCLRTVAAKGGNTSNMIAHLRDHHPSLFATFKNNGGSGSNKSFTAKCEDQPTIQQAFKKQVTYAPTSKHAKELNSAVAYFIAKDTMPFQAVEKPGFLKLMKMAVPLYKVPSRNFFSTNEIPKMYSEVKAHVQKQVEKGVWFSATTDLWTSSGGSGEPYISFTVHFLSPHWELKSVKAKYRESEHADIPAS